MFHMHVLLDSLYCLWNYNNCCHVTYENIGASGKKGRFHPPFGTGGLHAHVQVRQKSEKMYQKVWAYTIGLHVPHFQNFA